MNKQKSQEDKLSDMKDELKKMKKDIVCFKVGYLRKNGIFCSPFYEKNYKI